MRILQKDRYWEQKKSCAYKRSPLLVELSQLYSNTFQKIVKYKHSLPIDSSTSVNTTTPKRKAQNAYGETEVRHIRQRQKIFSDIEIQTICKMYQSGDSVYKLAKDFECHRSTISAVLKRNGIEVTHRALLMHWFIVAFAKDNRPHNELVLGRKCFFLNKLSFCVGQSSLACANIYLEELFAGTSPPINFRRVAVADVAGTTILPVPSFQRIIISFTSTMATENSSKHSLLR